MVTTFGEAGGVGEKLQTLLEQRAVEKDNWVSHLISLTDTGSYPVSALILFKLGWAFALDFE